ncbi:MAG: Txe/YoeB family addiction module toxin [Bergeyella sp.]
MSYKVIFLLDAQKDIERLKKSGNKILLKKLDSLLEELKEHPTFGTGKPEQLKHYEIPTWSRRISGEHRLVYRIQDELITVLVLSVYGHYNDK